MITLGITGGIGSGKSFVAQHFAALGVPYYNCDERSKQLTTTNQKIIIGLKQRFGDKVYAGGKLNKAFLSQRIFNDKSELEFINNLIHPVVEDDFRQWRDSQKTEIVMVESAILIESGFYRDCDKIVVVEAPLKLRINRVMRRDNLTEEQVKARISNQIDDDERRKFANFTIVNDGTNNIGVLAKEIINEMCNNK